MTVTSSGLSRCHITMPTPPATPALPVGPAHVADGSVALPFAPASPALDGSQGANRARTGHAQIAACTDLEAISAWLARFADSPNTFHTYRKEVERLWLWATRARHTPISSLTHDDLLAYQHFLADPQPRAQWVLASGRKVARAHPDWRPFAGPLSPASRRLAMTILNALFSWLVGAGYLAGNPLALSRQRARRGAGRIVRYLDDAVWGEVKHTIATLPLGTDRQREHAARARWLFSLLYLCGLRISEVGHCRMGDVFCRHDSDGEARWWLEVTGKGNKERIVPVSDALLAELARYRSVRGLTPRPARGETLPLVLPIGQQPRALTRAALHGIVKSVFTATAQRIRATQPDQAARAALVEQASAHWLRHTAGSNMANRQVDLRHVRDNLGHASLATTTIYLHATDDARHRQTATQHTLDW